jgi:hypothetical protein
VPRLILETDTEKKHFAAAELRKKLRQESLAKSSALFVELSEDEF